MMNNIRPGNKTVGKKLLINTLASFYLIVIPFNLSVSAQEGKKLLYEYIQHMERIKQPENGKVYYMNIEITSVLNNKAIDVPGVDAKIYLTKDTYCYESGMLSVYKDNNEMFCVNHYQKEIVWSKLTKNNFNSTSEVIMANAQKELIEKSRILKCSDTTIDSKRLKIIVLRPHEELQKKSNIERITYYYGSQSRRIEQVFIDYTRQNAVKSQTIIYKDLSFDYHNWKPSKAYNFVFDTKGKILTRYKTYKLTDNRS